MLNLNLNLDLNLNLLQTLRPCLRNGTSRHAGAWLVKTLAFLKYPLDASLGP